MLISQDDEVASQCCVLRRGFSVYESTKRGAGPGSIIFPGYLQFAAQVRDAANRIEMTDPRSWTRWHTCVARQNGQRLVGHSCISPNADAGLHGFRRQRSLARFYWISAIILVLLLFCRLLAVSIRWLVAVSHGRTAALPSWVARKHIDSGCRQHKGKSDDFWCRG